MTIQTNLFDTPIQNYRNSDPVSSRTAISIEQVTKQRTKVYLALKDHPNTTSKELAAICGLDRHMVAKRLPELRETGHVVNVRDESKPRYGITLEYPLLIRECVIGGKNSTVWIAVK
jgi:hypothetical protein